MKTTTIALTTVCLFVAGCALGKFRVYPDGVDILEAGTVECVVEMKVDIIQRGATVASGTAEADFSSLQSEFNDDNVDYNSPMQIKLEIVSASPTCPKEYQAPNVRWWPNSTSEGQLPPPRGGKYFIGMGELLGELEPSGN